MSPYGLSVALWIFALLTPFVQAEGGRQTNLSQLSLKGLVAFNVVVEQLGPKIEGKGLTREQLQTDLELRLREAGVTISKNAPALLYANVAVVCKELVCAYNINLEVQQAVRLSHAPASAPVLATTWKSGTTGLLLGDTLQVVRQGLSGQASQFLKAYVIANRQ